MEIQVDASGIYIAAQTFRGLRRQMPFISRLMLTAVARNAEKALKAEMAQKFDRPTPFTMNAVYSRGAHAKSPVGIVALRQFGGKTTLPEKYLAPEVLGGVRHVKRFELALHNAGILPAGMVTIPTPATPLDAYGNVSRGLLNKILSQLQAHSDDTRNETEKSKKRRLGRGDPVAGYFALLKPRGKLRPGIYARYQFAHGSAVRPVLYFHRMPHYAKRIRFWDLAIETIQKTAPAELAAAVGQAMATARPSPP